MYEISENRFQFLGNEQNKSKTNFPKYTNIQFQEQHFKHKKMTIIRDFQNAIYFSTLILIAVLKYRSGIPEALQLCHLSDA